MSFQMDISGMTEVTNALTMLQKSMRGKVAQAVNLSVQDALVVANQLTPYKTGKLKLGNKIKALTVTGLIIQYALYNDVEYAPYVCLGTKRMKARDFYTPAIAYGRKRLAERLQNILGGTNY